MELPSEMPHFVVPDATLQQLKCHTPLSKTYGIPDDEVWHFDRTTATNRLLSATNLFITPRLV